jgi:hypothetical protein
MMLARPIARLLMPRPFAGTFARSISVETAPASDAPPAEFNAYAANMMPPPNRDEKGFAMYELHTPTKPNQLHGN